MHFASAARTRTAQQQKSCTSPSLARTGMHKRKEDHTTTDRRFVSGEEFNSMWSLVNCPHHCGQEKAYQQKSCTSPPLARTEMPKHKEDHTATARQFISGDEFDSMWSLVYWPHHCGQEKAYQQKSCTSLPPREIGQRGNKNHALPHPLPEQGCTNTKRTTQPQTAAHQWRGV